MTIRHHTFIRECTNTNCNFRFPDVVSTKQAYFCPLCGASMTVVNEFEGSSDYHSQSRVVKQNKNRKILGVLDNIRSSYNVGSIFRTAEGFEIDRLILCGISPSPKQKKTRKTSMGAEMFVPWEYTPNAFLRCRTLFNEGYQIISLETNVDSVPIIDLQPPQIGNKVAFVVGNEVSGIDPEILFMSDLVCSIPMAGHNKSFNVTIAFGIAAFYLSSILI